MKLLSEYKNVKEGKNEINTKVYVVTMLDWVPVPTAWRVLGLRMEERPTAMEVSCEYIE
jgi:hypothetical protein